VIPRYASAFFDFLPVQVDPSYNSTRAGRVNLGRRNACLSCDYLLCLAQRRLPSGRTAFSFSGHLTCQAYPD